MSKISVVLHDEMYQQVLKNDKSLSLDTFASIDLYTEVDNDAVLSKAIQLLAKGDTKVLYTSKLEDGNWELRHIGPFDLGKTKVELRTDNLPKFDWMDEASPPDPSKLFGLRVGPMTASINCKMLGLVMPNFDDTTSEEEKNNEVQNSKENI